MKEAGPDKTIVQGPLAQITRSHKPIGVAHWETKIVKSLPKELKGSLPSIEDIEKELGNG